MIKKIQESLKWRQNDSEDQETSLKEGRIVTKIVRKKKKKLRTPEI